MEANKSGSRNPDDSSSQEIENADLNIDKTVSGKDITEEGRESRRHHQEYGNRKYESHTNHSSADDQPQNNGSGNPTTP